MFHIFCLVNDLRTISLMDNFHLALRTFLFFYMTFDCPFGILYGGVGFCDGVIASSLSSSAQIVGVVCVATATLFYVMLVASSFFLSFFPPFFLWRHGVVYLDLHISD